jgi:hypothetical protein
MSTSGSRLTERDLRAKGKSRCGGRRLQSHLNQSKLLRSGDVSMRADRGAQEDADDNAYEEFRHEPHSNLDERDYSMGYKFRPI